MFSGKIILQTNRLILRRWRAEDLKPFSDLNADLKVMEFFPSVLTETESNDMARIIEEQTEKNGFGLWAAELKETGQFIGFVGISIPRYALPFSPCVEIGWRLARQFWGKGLAPEAALACLHLGFDQFHLSEIVSFTTEKNLKSRRVMEKIGMHYGPKDDFDHPNLSADHPLRRHVLYRIKKME